MASVSMDVKQENNRKYVAYDLRMIRGACFGNEEFWSLGTLNGTELKVSFAGKIII